MLCRGIGPRVDMRLMLRLRCVSTLSLDPTLSVWASIFHDGPIITMHSTRLNYKFWNIVIFTMMLLGIV